MSLIKIRKYQLSDAKSLAQIYYNTIHNINIADYTKEQIEAWAPLSSLEKLEGWKKKWQKIVPIIAIYDNIIAGFAEFENNGHIDCFYVHHQFQGKGIGKALMGKIEKEADLKNIKRIYAEVSITAKSFFEKMGFDVVKEQIITIRGVKLKNFLMEKLLK